MRDVDEIYIFSVEKPRLNRPMEGISPPEEKIQESMRINQIPEEYDKMFAPNFKI